MSIVMSTMAKQQQQQQQSGPAVFKLNAICAKLKRPDDDEDDEDDETGDEDLVYRHVDVDVDVDDEVDSGNCRQNGRSTVVNSGERLDDLPSSSGAALYDSDDDGTDFGLHYSAAFSATNDVETDAVESTSSPAAVPEASGYDRGGGRRNKRKNFKPRNIVYQYESCEDGEMDFPSTSVSMPASRTHVYASGNAQDLALRRCSSDSGGDCGQQPLDLSESFSDCPRDVPGPMDLSVRSHSPSGGDNSSDQSDDSDSLAIDLTKSGARESVGIEADQSSCSSDHGLAGSPRFVSDDQQYPSASGLGQSDHTVGDDDDDKSAGDDRSSPNVPSATDASTLKDYAESTMKELLGLYGFNDMAESLTKNVPLDNFSSGKILQTMTPRRADPQASCPTPPTTSSVTNNNQRTPSPHTHPSHHPHIPTMHHQQPSRHHHHHHHHHQHNVRTSTADGPNYDALCTKVVDSMAKLAHLPPNSIIGNPRVILPPNMTSTILTLAAMQESKFALKAPPLQPLMSHQAHQTIRKTQPSVIVSSSSSVLPLLSHKEHLSKAGPIDYTRYVKRYSSATECGSNYCKDLNYREHFHCMDCNARVFVKKEEMIRHFKWHKKRDESLQHGFLRFSPMDDCSERFHNCSHNRKQTHYHCLKEGCDKVYISTSDVQMHANYHRKDSAIIQEGFQRFRATEDCAMSTCSFYGQRTTHFHCRRANCNFTFKNKADMEKHKTYHIKDEQLNRDGFKKFMKHEHCTFESCRYSRVCNHIHCIRAGCTYVLHSSGQLYSHKRKHERRDNELAYRKYKLAQSMLKTLGDSQALALSSQMSEEGNSSESTGSGIQSSNSVPVIHGSTSNSSVSMGNSSASVAGVNSSLGLSIPMLPPGSKAAAEQLMASGHLAGIPGVEHLAAMDLANELLKPKPDDSWKRYLIRYTANDPCKPNCEFLYKDHYHCTTENCTMMFRSKDGVREHAKTHEQQDQVTEAFYNAVEVGQVGQCPTDCPYQSREKHYHCGWENCHEIILPSDKAFRRLDHYKMHDYSRKLNISKDHLSMTLATSMDSMFKRKRGRPPKNRVIEVWPQFPMPSSPSELPQAIFTSFKLPKPGPQMATPHLSLGVTVPCTTATTQSFLDHHSTPLSAMAMPFGLLPASLLPGRPSPLVTPVATSLPVPLMTPITTSPMQTKAFSSYLQMQPHLAKHTETTGSKGGTNLSISADDDSVDVDDSEDGQDNGKEPEAATEAENLRCSPPHLPSPSDPPKNLHPNLFPSPISESPIYFPPQQGLMAVGGYHGLLPHHPYPLMTRPPEDASSPQQNGGNMADFDAEQSSQESAYSGTSPRVEENVDSTPHSPRLVGMGGSRKRNPSPRNEDYNMSANDAKKARMTSSMASLRILKDEPVPQGYIRYRFNEDCQYQHCGYREHQTHFHCVRRDCGYSFCDKTRFVQHTARHERLDTLMGGDFQQFRANVACGRPDCLYTISMTSASGSSTNKASHFHCIKCEYVCTDTNKVVAHRRQHQKLDNIMAAGFEKFTPVQNCNVDGCTHNQKQTHYHCMKCQYAVLGLSQMSAHKYRHLE